MTQKHPSESEVPRVAPQTVHDTTPALGWYSDHVLFHRIWNRAALGRRDRSVITVSALIASGHFAQLTGHFGRALDHGVTPDELSELVTQMAFVCGWPNAMSAVKVLREVLESRNIPVERTAQPTGTTVDLRSSADHASAGSVAALLDAELGTIVDADLWHRPILSMRDRALAGLTAMIATANTPALPGAVDLALANGVDPAQLSEVVLHLGHYVGIAKARQAAVAIDARPGVTPITEADRT